mgnify:CR=1 FL=1
MRLLVLLVTTLFSFQSLAVWTLQSDDSIISFTSTKNHHITEAHLLSTLKGNIQASGSAKLIVDLNDVDTKIDIRNQRLKEMFFETVKFPTAEYQTNVGQKFIKELQVGESKELMLQGKLSLHGEKKSKQIPVYVTKVSEKKILVVSITPLIINTDEFALTQGLMKLQEIAKLEMISKSVNVNFVLTFVYE